MVSMIKEVRTAYRISQSQLAGYLNITRSHLSMAAIGKRELPTSSVMILAKLYATIQAQNIDSAINEGLQLTAMEKKQLESFINKKIEDNEYYLYRASRTLNKMKEDRLQAARILESLKLLNKEAEQGEKKGFDVVEKAAKKLYNASGEDLQFALELRICGIKAEIAFLKKKSENPEGKASPGG